MLNAERATLNATSRNVFFVNKLRHFEMRAEAFSSLQLPLRKGTNGKADAQEEQRSAFGIKGSA